ncbi:MAG: cytochrome P450, partial [Acidimicrobiia bacterium]
EDHERWKQWSQGMNRAAILNGRNRASDDLAEDVRALAQQSLLAWYSYLTDLVAGRSGGMGDDLVSTLVRSSESGEGLSDLEVVGTIGLLIGAGHDTTANLIANAVLALMRNPEQYELLRADPSLASAAVEETSRYDGSARGQPRVALEDVEIGGEVIRAGDTVMVIANAANRDPEKFTDPERFDITRREGGHVAFAAGIHFCVGAPLARMEAEVALRRLTQLPQRFALATEELTYKPTHGRNLTALPVRAC